MRTDCALNIILIGMPGAGKSTVGMRVAERLGYRFIDTDQLIQDRHGMTLQQIIDERGMATFKQIEEDVLCDLTTRNAVIATGGSAVYSDRAMQHLRRFGNTVYLDIPLAELQQRVDNMQNRGLVLECQCCDICSCLVEQIRNGGDDFSPEEGLAVLYDRRAPLYSQFADITINGAGLDAEALAAAIERNVCG